MFVVFWFDFLIWWLIWGVVCCFYFVVEWWVLVWLVGLFVVGVLVIFLLGVFVGLVVLVVVWILSCDLVDCDFVVGFGFGFCWDLLCCKLCRLCCLGLV